MPTCKRPLTKTLLTFGLIAVFLVSCLSLTGCGDKKPGTEANKPELLLGDMSWDSIQVHNRIAGFILEHGYGYPVDYRFGESITLFQGLGNGDIQILMEAWVDNYGETYTKLLDEGKILNLGTNFADAPQGWYVPTYMIEGDPTRGIEPLTPELKSVQDLPKYWKVFQDPEYPNKGRFHNSTPGWACTEINEEKFKAYGLNQYNIFSTGSDTAEQASMLSAYEKGEPWFGYYWEPTWIMGKLNMTRLEEPPYDENIWNTNRACTYPSATVLICVNRQLEETAPEVLEFLRKYDTSLEQNNRTLAYMQEHNDDKQAAALWFLKEYPDTWKSWVPAEVATKVEEALKKG
ncbi:MAG: ABC transporter substrate-binding protein [Syntrophomonadaceae bacterium]|nr:ABC transporter substrate-binding protein [Syntrophomonadaceae bacterium]